MFLLGANSAGLLNKKESFERYLNLFLPGAFFVQETKLKKKRIKLNKNLTKYSGRTGNRKIKETWTTSTEENPTHTYAVNGIYTVKLQASNILGVLIETEQEIEIELENGAQADFNIQKFFVCHFYVLNFVIVALHVYF